MPRSHLPSTGKLGAFKLTKLAGAYWRGDVAPRCSPASTAPPSSSRRELDEHLRNLEEAEKRDHRKLGRELGIYTMDPLAGVGLPMYLPKARVIRTMAELAAPRSVRARLRGGHHAALYNAGRVEDLGPLRLLQREHVLLQHQRGGTDEDPRLTEYAVKPMNCRAT